MAKSEQDKLAEILVASNDGKVMFNFGDISRITGQGRNNIGAYLQESGILVKKVGNEKLLNVFQVAEFMLKDRIAPIDNTSRGIVSHQRKAGRGGGRAVLGRGYEGLCESEV